ncbi:hypothetical protein GWK47_009110 [Chionoecetes opilio]|uniref:Uncharacterized protein n=1 Tax=Chionoecetes opilio TaxID=41210 RepID=A0A8J4XX60_CHIOP|nr:hypothetical protein GWK47_009110 [Chionoecetes opilio]
MENSPLAWSSCPPTYLGLLDRVQARAQRLKSPEAAARILQLLPSSGVMWQACASWTRFTGCNSCNCSPAPQATGTVLHCYPCSPQHRPFGFDCALREDGTLPPLLPSTLWLTMETLVRPDRPAPHHVLHAFKSGVNIWLQAEPTQ